MAANIEAGFGQRLQDWLTNLGFEDDPFARYEAEREGEDLPNIFVDRPYLEEILGNPLHPRAGFLLAGRGTGKTATREIVANECAHGALRRRALAVRYFDFSPLLEACNGDLNRIDARLHVRFLARAVIKSLADDVPSTYFERLGLTDQALLLGYVLQFGDPLTRLTLTSLLHGTPPSLTWEELSPAEILTILARLVTRLGPPPGPLVPEFAAKSGATEIHYHALYILVDRVDETPAGVAAAVPLLLPLVRDRPLLEAPHIAFKFFLPAAVGEQLQAVVDLRADRVSFDWITWDEAALREVVARRLAFYSHENIMRLEELCHSRAKERTLARLIEAAQGSPRTLLRLCRALIHHVVRQGKTLIYAEDVTATLADFAHQLTVEQAPGLLNLPERSPSAFSPRETLTPDRDGLFLDIEGGHVWIDRSQLTPPLTAQEFALLRSLYTNAPEIVPAETLMQAVWPADPLLKGDEQNLRKLISRLRRRLEPQSADAEWRFIHSSRGRGYWLDNR